MFEVMEEISQDGRLVCVDFAECQSREDVLQLLSAIGPVEILEENPFPDGGVGMMIRAGGRMFEVIS